MTFDFLGVGILLFLPPCVLQYHTRIMDEPTCRCQERLCEGDVPTLATKWGKWNMDGIATVGPFKPRCKGMTVDLDTENDLT